MKINIVAVGKIKEKFYVDALDEYVKRMSRYADFKVVELSEASASKSPQEQIEIESNRLLEKAKGFVVALDPKGEKLTSNALAQKISQKALEGISEISFLIGGSFGLDKKLKDKSDMLLSFSDMTFPHQLFRVMLAEQIYRAFTIINNTPYHK